MNYLVELAVAIRKNHGCEATFCNFVAVTELFRNKVAWQGEVAVFAISGHPKAKFCYAWGYPPDDAAKNREIITVLAVPPVVSPEAAVKVAIASTTKLGKT